MTKSAIRVAGALLLLGAGPAFADAGVRPVWSDFQPAVSTQYRPPDGGRRYLPPNTKALVRNLDQQALPSKASQLKSQLPKDSSARRIAPLPPPSPSSTDPLLTPPSSTLTPTPVPKPLPNARDPIRRKPL